VHKFKGLTLCTPRLKEFPRKIHRPHPSWGASGCYLWLIARFQALEFNAQHDHAHMGKLNACFPVYRIHTASYSLLVIPLAT
jgi:hypothetical protein